jgi:pilus assembly protein Flp/PilA
MIYLMQEFLNVLRVRKANQEKGQTLIEYALIIALIVIVVIAAMLLLGPQIATLYNSITSCLKAPNATNCK